MTKTRSRIKIIITAVLIFLGLFLTFGNFILPTTNTTYRGFFNAINYGYDIAGGRLSIYEVSSDNKDSDMGNLSSKIDRIVGDYEANFSSKGMSVTRQGDTIRIEISNFDNDNIASTMSRAGFSVDLFDIMGSSQGIKFSKQSSFDSVEEDAIDGTYIENCTIATSQAGNDGTIYFPLQITFNAEGQERFRALTKEIAESTSDKLHVYVNGQDYTSSGIEVSSAVSSLSLSTTSQNSAEALRLQILALAKPLLLSKVIDSGITASLNTTTSSLFGNTKNMLMIALSALLVATFVYLIVRYRMLGLFGSMSILAFIVVFSFLLQSIPLVVMDMAGVVGVLLTYILLVTGMISIFERARDEYSAGKKIPNSVNTAFRKNVLPVLERYAFLLIFAIIVFLVGTSAIKHFAFVVFIGLFANYFTLFVPLKGLCSLYVNINSTKKGYYNLKREARKDE